MEDRLRRLEDKVDCMRESLHEIELNIARLSMDDLLNKVISHTSSIYGIEKKIEQLSTANRWSTTAISGLWIFLATFAIWIIEWVRNLSEHIKF